MEALIHIASALVKVMDETSDGIIDNKSAHTKLADNAMRIVSQLEDAADAVVYQDHGFTFDDDVIPEDELTNDEKRIKRMAEEYDELCGRIERLWKFFETDKYKSLSDDHKGLLGHQYCAMRDYMSALGKRIQIECEKG